MVKITGLGGSLSQTSTSLAALRIAIDAAAGAGAEVELFDIREMNLPMFDPTSKNIPPNVMRSSRGRERAALRRRSSTLTETFRTCRAHRRSQSPRNSRSGISPSRGPAASMS